ncbi:MAG TPA: dipeptide epimerase [Candidatus Limnocylindrales bacterium]|nr:dipeptide epimerase [Candidatus Limnocylindrales bacterium]
MGLSVRHEVLRLPLRDPFVIARAEHGAGRSITTVLVELRDDRHPAKIALGEGYPDPYYGETPATIAAVTPLLLDAVGEPELTPDELAAAAARMDAAIAGHGAAKCALDIALHDLAAQVAGLPLHAFLGLPAVIPPTDFTLGLDEPAVVAERARRAAHFPALKIKVGGPADVATLEAVRAVYAGPLRVDANTGWTPDVARTLLPDLVRLGVELIEQPFPARRLDWLRNLQAMSDLPIVADESAVRIDDLDGLVDVVAGVNVKLAKCGGVGPAARMLARARELGFRTFLGCMEETSVGIAASAAVASLAEWVDLDGNLLLADDPVAGLELGPDCRWLLSNRPGLGVHRRAG